MTGSRFSIGLLALGLTVLAITLAFVLWPPGLRNESEAALPSASEVSEVSSPPELAQEPASEAAPSVPGMAEGSRAVTPATALRGVLRDSEGRAITGARLAWTVLGDELCPPGTQVDPQARAAIEAASVRTTSGAGGAFQFRRMGRRSSIRMCCWCRCWLLTHTATGLATAAGFMIARWKNCGPWQGRKWEKNEDNDCL